MAEAPQLKDRFVNRSGGFLGATVRAPGSANGFRGISLYPGQEIDLDIAEQEMTANAPRDPRANPLANGQLVCIAGGLDFKGRRPLRPDANILTADPTNPATWSEEQRSHVATEAEKLTQEKEALAAQAETGLEVDPSLQPEVGAIDPFAEHGLTPVEQPPVVGGQTISGAVERADQGEPVETTETPAEAFLGGEEAPTPVEMFPPAETDIRGPAERLQPPSSLQGSDRPRPVTST